MSLRGAKRRGNLQLVITVDCFTPFAMTLRATFDLDF